MFDANTREIANIVFEQLKTKPLQRCLLSKPLLYRENKTRGAWKLICTHAGQLSCMKSLQMFSWPSSLPIPLSTSSKPHAPAHFRHQTSNPMTFFWKAPGLKRRAETRRPPRTRGRVRLRTAWRKSPAKRAWTSCWYVSCTPATPTATLTPVTHRFVLADDAGLQQGAGVWVRRLRRLAAHFQPVPREGGRRRRARAGRRQDRREVQGVLVHV